MKRLRFYCFINFSQNTDIQMSGKSVKLHDWPKIGKSITCTMDNFVPLVIPGLSSYSSSSLSSTSKSTDQSNYSKKLGTLSDPVATRSDKHACGKPMLTDPDKQATGNHGPAFIFLQDEEGGCNARHSCLVTAFHSKSSGPGDACARTFLWKSDLKFGRWCFKSGDTKTEAQ